MCPCFSSYKLLLKHERTGARKLLANQVLADKIIANKIITDSGPIPQPSDVNHRRNSLGD